MEYVSDCERIKLNKEIKNSSAVEILTLACETGENFFILDAGWSGMDDGFLLT